MNKELSIDIIKDAVSFDPSTGLFIWNYRDNLNVQWNARFSGKPSFKTLGNNGYYFGRINQISLYAHRVAWAVHYGSWPEGDIDHINGDKTDNRIDNLRLANKSKNGMNRGPQKNNKSGVKGVYFDKTRGKWAAQIKARGKYHKLGRFLTLEDAKSAYESAAAELHKEFMRIE